MMSVGGSKKVRTNWACHSPPDIGGEDATSGRSREASFNGADGVVENGTSSKNAFRNTSAIRTTPSAPLRWLRIFFLMAQPPLLYQEGNGAPNSSITPSLTARAMRGGLSKTASLHGDEREAVPGRARAKKDLARQIDESP